MRRGLIELGSNSFRLVVADAAGPIETRSHYLGLARSVSAHGSLTGDDILTAARIARELHHCAVDLGCDQIAVVATEAFRLASNGEAAAERIGDAIGGGVRILTPEEEVTLAYEAVFLDGLSPQGFVMIDLGGGSLGVAAGRPGQLRPDVTASYRMGVHLLAPRVLSGELLPTAGRIRLEHFITEQLDDLPVHPDALDRLPVVVVGGAARSIARIIHTARRAAVPDSERGLVIDCADLGHLIGRTSDLPRSGRLALPGVKPHRADTLPLAATILRQVLRHLGAEHATVSAVGLREGGLGRLQTTERRAA